MKNKFLVLIGHAFAGWILCAATMGIGMAVTSLEKALIIHAIAAPCFFAIISFLYFTKNQYLSPEKTALVFLGFVIAMDFFVVALIINRSLDMFTSFMGTWLPFTLIFLSTWITGYLVTRYRKQN